MSIPETSTQGHAVPRFSIFKPFSTEKVDTLKHCFMHRTTLNKNNLPALITAKDGLVYTAVYDCRFPDHSDAVEVIISFQQHNYGRYAIIRIANEQKRRRF